MIQVELGKASGGSFKIVSFPEVEEKYSHENLTKQEKVTIASEVKSIANQVIDEQQIDLKISHIKYSLENEEGIPKSEFDTVIEAYIPYAIYVPNGFSVNMNQPVKSKVTFFKEWTDKAKGSLNFDVIGEKKLFYRDYTVATSYFPKPIDSDWKPNITGKNIEMNNDTVGYFRYSKLIIEMDTQMGKSTENRFDHVYQDTYFSSLKIANSLIELYRNTTGEFHLRKLNKIFLGSIFFPKQNWGLYPNEFNVRNAIINHSQDTISTFRERLENGESLKMYQLLLDDAKAALTNNEFKLAVTESFQAFDVFVDVFLLDWLIKKGVEEKVALEKIEGKTTKTKINPRNKQSLIVKYGIAVNMNATLYDEWGTKYNTIRIPAIHGTKDIGRQEAISSIEINEQMIAHFLTL